MDEQLMQDIMVLLYAKVSKLYDEAEQDPVRHNEYLSRAVGYLDSAETILELLQCNDLETREYWMMRGICAYDMVKRGEKIST